MSFDEILDYIKVMDSMGMIQTIEGAKVLEPCADYQEIGGIMQMMDAPIWEEVDAYTLKINLDA